MPLTSILFLLLFIFCSVGSLFNPVLGIIGYMGHYHIAPEIQWWGVALDGLGIRYSFTIAILLLIGTIVNKNKLSYKTILHKQEILLIIFIIIIWISKFTGFEADVTAENYPPPKITKVAIFLLLFTHIVTDLKRYRLVIWTFVLLGLYLGYSCYTAPASAFSHGRLTYNIGGPDFAESSFLGAHFVAILPFIAIMFLAGNKKHKIIALVAGAFVVNAIVLTQTRAAFVGAIAGAMFVVVKSLPQYRKKIIIALIIGLIGAFSLTDHSFWERMGTINETNEDGQLEESAESRKILWGIAWDIMKARPIGLGAGNFARYMHEYNEIYSDRDTHNTYFRCGAELGFHGLILMIIMIINSLLILNRVIKKSIGLKDESTFQLYAYMLQLTLIMYFIAGIFMSQTYVEEFWWFLLLPVCLERALENYDVSKKISTV